MSLDKVVNVAILLTCACVVGNLAYGVYRGAPITVHKSVPYQPGDVVKDTGELTLTKSGKTLVLVTASHCQFCTESMPFFRSLTEAAKHAGTRVVAVTAEAPDVNRRYLASHDVHPDAVVESASNGINAPGTPTLILLRRDGEVVNSWLGRLAPKQQAELLASVSHP